jgi:hypothetical protein
MTIEATGTARQQRAPIQVQLIQSNDNAKAAERTVELLRSYLPIYDSYHNQKEAIVIAFTVFYLGGASALVAADRPFWEYYTIGSFVAFVALIVAALVLSCLFVFWQLELRRVAGEIYKACNIVLSKWSFSLPTDTQIESIEGPSNVPLMKGFRWPNDLVSTFEQIRRERPRFWPPFYFTFIPMVIWTVGVLWRVIAAWKPPLG